MILETWTETERVALQQIEVQLLHMFREGLGSDALYEYLLTCQRWTSARVVIFAAMVAGGIYKGQKEKSIEQATAQACINLDKKIEKLFEAIDLVFPLPEEPKHK